MRKAFCGTWVLGLLLICGASPADDSIEAQAQFQALDDEYSLKLKAYRAIVSSANPSQFSREDQVKFATEHPGPEAEYARRFLDLARKYPRTEAAVLALRATIVIGKRSQESREAIEQLRRDWSLHPKIAIVCLQIGSSPNPTNEPLLREILEKNPDRTARGLACLALANLVSGLSTTSEMLAKDPQDSQKLRVRIGQERLDLIKLRDSNADAREAEALFERVVREFADVKLTPEFKTSRLIGHQAETWLAERGEMKVGNPAPVIDGKDLDGRPIKLGDYRGKVVVINFWASWCGPCMVMLPHERDLVKRLEGKPFVMLGINCDRTEAAARSVMAREAISWPNIYDGLNQEGSVADRYHVLSYPTIYVLDGEGIIRFKGVRGTAMDRAVDELLAGMAAR